jgi:lysophospholipase L1-like esterase
MIGRILAALPECEIVLMVMNPMVEVHAAKRPELERFNDVYRQVACELGLLLIDHYPAWQHVLERDRAEFDRLVPDGAHPGPLGCARIITPGIWRALGLDSGADRSTHSSRDHT